MGNFHSCLTDNHSVLALTRTVTSADCRPGESPETLLCVFSFAHHTTTVTVSLPEGPAGAGLRTRATRRGHVNAAAHAALDAKDPDSWLRLPYWETWGQEGLGIGTFDKEWFVREPPEDERALRASRLFRASDFSKSSNGSLGEPLA